MTIPILSTSFSNSFLLSGLFTSIVITITLIFDDINKAKLKNEDMSVLKHIIILFFQVLAISLFVSYLMYYVFGYGGGNLTPCQNVIKKSMCKNILSYNIPHFINWSIMILAFMIVLYIYNTESLNNKI